MYLSHFQWQLASVGSHKFPIKYNNGALIIVDAGPNGGGYIPGCSLDNDLQGFSCSREGSGGNISTLALGN